MPTGSKTCPACSQPWTDAEMVQCDDCDLWFHYRCVGVDDGIKDKPWKCHQCGGDAYPPASLSEKKTEELKPQRTEPTVKELLVLLEKQQEREHNLLEKFEKQQETENLLRTELEKLSNEYGAVKRLLDSKPSQHTDVHAAKPEENDEIFQRILENEARLSQKTVASVERQSRVSSGNSDSKLDELAVLMKQAHVEELPKFSGNIKDWPLFLAVFKRTTMIASIDDVTNVGRLTKALQGEAKRLVLDQLTFGLNPKSIIETLEKRYGKKDEVLRTLSLDLMNFPVISSARDPNLQEFAVALKTYVAQLKSLGLHEDLKSTLLESMLHQKLVNLPSMYRRWVQIRQRHASSNIEKFADFVMEEWESLPPTPPENDRISKGKSSVKTLNVHSSADGRNQKPCFSCGGRNHKLPSCYKFKKLNVRERWEFVKDEGICFSCLMAKDHHVIDCPEKKICSEIGCEMPHHRLLHSSTTYQPNLNANAETFEPARDNSEIVSQQVRGHNFNHQVHAGEDVGEDATVTAKVVAVRIFGPDGSFVDDHAFLDDGSTLTMMERQIAEKLGLVGEDENLHLQWTKGITRTERALKCDVTISGINRKNRFVLNNVYCVPNLDLAPSSQDGDDLSSRYRHLRGLPLPTFQNVKPGLLIGLEHATLLGGRSVIEGKEDEPLASNTKLGWIVYGRHSIADVRISGKTIEKQGFQQTHLRLGKCNDTDDRQLHELVKSFFSVENLGVAAKQLKSAEDERAEMLMKSTMKMVDGRYEVGLLWKTDDIVLPDNKKMAMQRLLSEERKLLRDQPSLTWMNEHVQKLITKGYAREATAEDLNTTWRRTWICPLFTVINQNKVPPKRRCVADVAAVQGGVSLNSCLLQGPDNLIALPAALCRARENPVMVTADVAEMFHQVRITREDQQCQRFLWRNGDQSQPPKTFIMEVMMFGPTCSPFQAQHVKNIHAAKYLDKYPEAAEALERFMYMDDYFNSHQSVDEAVRVTLEAIQICSEMGFDLVQVQSSHEEVLSRIPQRHLKQELVSLNLEEASTYFSKLLGMYWMPAEDVFVFRRTFDDLLEKMCAEKYVPTKREVLSAVMKIFDPKGLIAKYVIRGKSLLQDVWREGINWDESLSENLATEWLRFLQAFDEIEKVKIPRWYGGSNLQVADTELVVFVDASAKAYAAVGYFRFPSSSPAHIALVMAKAKVAPVKTMSIPRLELEAAKLGARLAVTIGNLHSFPIKKRFFLSDSKCVLSWIHSKTFNFVPFVAHRVSEILDLTTAREWYYVPTKENVADEATKETSSSEGEDSARWFHGPGFLQQPLDSWPIKKFEVEKVGEVALHRRQEIENFNPETHFLNRVGGKYQSDWRRLVRVTAYIIIGAKSFKVLKSRDDLTLTVLDLEEAEKEIFRFIQRDQLEKLWTQVENLAKDSDVSGSFRVPGETTVWPVMMRSDEKLLRLDSRDKASKESFSAKNLILLPKRHRFVQLYLQHLHEQNHHMGIEGTIASAREKVWIVAIRQALKTTITHCQVCKNLKANPKLPTMGDLHVSRTAFDQKPFSFVGVDCFGPITVREKRSSAKRWGVIFTCLTYRAVHLEVVLDLSADQMVLAVRRLIARRGPVKVMFSDNGRNFVGANTIAGEDARQALHRLSEAASRKMELEWRFIPAYSPWMGGAWERLIGYIKKCIKFCLAGETPTDAVLNNALIEAELLTNKRPLTHTPIDPDDEEPLTPNLALFGSSDAAQVTTLNDDANQFSRASRKRVAHLVEKFRKRWEREYLPAIAKREQPRENRRRIEIGDVVLLTEGEANRENWKLGRVIRIHPTRDEVPRIVDVKMGSGEIKYNRAVGNLAVLEVSSSASF